MHIRLSSTRPALRRRGLLFSGLVVAMLLGTLPFMRAAAATGTHVAGDFNGDGYADLAIGASADDDGTGYPSGVGSVSVAYGSASGLNTATSTRFDPFTAGMPSQLAACMQSRLDITFGFALATGDFNNDGYADLAIGVPSCWTTKSTEPGAVLILLGSSSGLSTINSEWLPSAFPSSSVAGMGFTLATGDFNHDGFMDLAAGAPFNDVGAATRDGSVAIFSGSSTGLHLSSTFSGTSSGWPGPAPAYDDALSFSIAAGDFNGDGNTDLAAAEPGKSGVVVLFGGTGGLTTGGAQYLQGLGPFGGQAIAAGDFNGDGRADLAVGASCAVHTSPNRGVVELHYGGRSGVGSVKFKSAQEFWVTKSGMPPTSGSAPQYFGLSLASGDFNHDGRADLVVSGGPGFYVLNGGSTQLGTKGSKLISDGTSEQAFGAGDFNGTGFDDLAVGYGAISVPDHPHVNVYKGSSTGVVSSSLVSLYQGPSGVVTSPGSNSTEDLFGQSVSPPGTSGFNNRFCGGP